MPWGSSKAKKKGLGASTAGFLIFHGDFLLSCSDVLLVDWEFDENYSTILFENRRVWMFPTALGQYCACS